MIAAEKRMREELAQHSLADLADRVASRAPASHGTAIAHWLEERSNSRGHAAGAGRDDP